ncbi:MAG: ectoine synthase [Gallionella sp.]
MNVLHYTELADDRVVECPKGGFVSRRLLLGENGMGFTMTRTTVKPTKVFQRWHYKHHLEACYCIKGHGILKDVNGVQYQVVPGTMYALDKHDKHFFKALDTVILICVFNPPLTGQEIHQFDGSYQKAAHSKERQVA